jgi:hypothetical protein
LRTASRARVFQSVTTSAATDAAEYKHAAQAGKAERIHSLLVSSKLPVSAQRLLTCF